MLFEAGQNKSEGGRNDNCSTQVYQPLRYQPHTRSAARGGSRKTTTMEKHLQNVTENSCNHRESRAKLSEYFLLQSNFQATRFSWRGHPYDTTGGTGNGNRGVTQLPPSDNHQGVSRHRGHPMTWHVHWVTDMMTHLRMKPKWHYKIAYYVLF